MFNLCTTLALSLMLSVSAFSSTSLHTIPFEDSPTQKRLVKVKKASGNWKNQFEAAQKISPEATHEALRTIVTAYETLLTEMLTIAYNGATDATQIDSEDDESDAEAAHEARSVAYERNEEQAKKKASDMATAASLHITGRLKPSQKASQTPEGCDDDFDLGTLDESLRKFSLVSQDSEASLPETSTPAFDTTTVHAAISRMVSNLMGLAAKGTRHTQTLV